MVPTPKSYTCGCRDWKTQQTARETQVDTESYPGDPLRNLSGQKEKGILHVVKMQTF